MEEKKEPEEVTIFDKCPACGGTDFFVDQLAAEVKAKGWMHMELAFYAEIVPKGQPYGVVHENSPAMDAKIPIGSKLPAYRIMLDVCLDCGNYFARKIVRSNAVKQLQPPKPGELPPQMDSKGRPLVFGSG